MTLATTLRPAGQRCLFCRQRLYLVQNAEGEQFYISHQGRRWCPLRAHRVKQGSKQQRRKKRR